MVVQLLIREVSVLLMYSLRQVTGQTLVLLKLWKVMGVATFPGLVVFPLMPREHVALSEKKEIHFTSKLANSPLLLMAHKPKRVMSLWESCTKDKLSLLGMLFMYFITLSTSQMNLYLG